MSGWREFLKFVKFTEHNDHEGETWNFWLQLDGNEAEIEKLSQLLNTFEGGGEISYELNTTMVLENEVDAVVKHSDQGYMNYHNKVTGTFTCPVVDEKLIEDEISDEAFEWLDNQFYKGDIERHFA